MTEYKQPNNFLLKLIVFILCAALGILSYFTVFSSKYGILEQNKQNSILHEQITQLNIKLIILQKSQQQAESNFRELSHKQLAIESIVVGYSPESQLKYTELKMLLNTANQGLVSFNDVQNAIELLYVANNLVTLESGAQFESLHASIQQDIDKLQQIKVIENLANLNTDVTKLEELSSKLILKQPTQNIHNEPTNQIGFWDKLKHSLSSVIKITKISDKQNTSSKPVDVEIMPFNENLELTNSMIKIALISHNQELWQSNLLKLEQNIRDNYKNDADSNEAIQLIEFLKTTNLNQINNKNINATLDLFNQIMQNYR